MNSINFVESNFSLQMQKFKYVWETKKKVRKKKTIRRWVREYDILKPICCQIIWKGKKFNIWLRQHSYILYISWSLPKYRYAAQFIAWMHWEIKQWFFSNIPCFAVPETEPQCTRQILYIGFRLQIKCKEGKPETYMSHFRRAWQLRKQHVVNNHSYSRK